jgi:hypothetical protein
MLADGGSECVLPWVPLVDDRRPEKRPHITGDDSQHLSCTGRAAVCTHTDRIHPIPIDVVVRLVLSPIRRAEAVVSRRPRYLILYKT